MRRTKILPPILALVVALGCGGAASGPEAGEASPTMGSESTKPADPGEEAPPEAAAPAERAESAEPGSSVQSSRAPSAEAGTPVTYACRLADDYNECVVERLEGRATTEAQLMQLIQSYRLLGRTDDARRHMEDFIERYPDSPQAQTYRDHLGAF